MTLSADERAHVPGWLLKLLDGDDVYAIGYAERHCSIRYHVRLLADRRIELEDTTPEPDRVEAT